jgi:hypothetical protein
MVLKSQGVGHAFLKMDSCSNTVEAASRLVEQERLPLQVEGGLVLP